MPGIKFIPLQESMPQTWLLHALRYGNPHRCLNVGGVKVHLSWNNTSLDIENLRPFLHKHRITGNSVKNDSKTAKNDV
ncbi:MAG: hypothetical protein HFH68_11035 [Lachnospiraceae bacterium]|nr:hypothetical protein [Lachnospiraceae bacterium]